MKIIPAIDIIEGKCVRLTKGDYNTKKIYHEDPLEVALEFQDHGIEYLHLVDLDGAQSNRIINYKVLERIANGTKLKIDFGGGLKSDEDVHIAFNSGAIKITGGSVALKNKNMFLGWLGKYGPQKIILGADCKDRLIATDGWMEASEIDVIEFIKSYENEGVKHVISTDIAKDGMLAGPSFNLYHEIMAETNINLIASGGIASMDDLHVLKKSGCTAAIIGKAIYEEKITLKALSKLC